ncbi:hypothetical protein ACS0TY_015067 [Phlomoides rotata]
MADHIKPHAIMISAPYQGHINPFVSLALKLASKGFTVTFVHHEIVHHKLCKALHTTTNEVDFFSEARQSGLDIRYTTISDGSPLNFDRETHYLQHWESLVYGFPALVDEFVGKMLQSEAFPAPNLMVTDTICAWPAAIAEKYKLVNVSFWSQSALVFSLLSHLDLLRQNNHFPCKDNADEEINYIPGVESISTRNLMPFLYQSESKGLMIKALLMAFKEVKRADFILHNTVHELESQTLSALNKYQPIYTIGPINFFENLVQKTHVNMSLWSESDCTRWLESKSPASVLYVSFGSFVHINKQIIEEIAYGLLLSEVNFIWIIRDGILGTIDSNVLPKGFEDEVKDRGLIIGWCNQIKVLSNPAVGGFLTHCGWNSTLESMWCGVPMICYPIAHDQPTNRKIVVDDWNTGINLCDRKSIDRKKVAEKIKNFMGGNVLEDMKRKADEVKMILRSAMEGDDGSSERNFEHFINDLKDKIHSINKPGLRPD